MDRTTQRLLAGAALIAALAASAALAQQPQTARVRGPIEAVDGSTLTVKAGEAGGVKGELTHNAPGDGGGKAGLADIKPGALIRGRATPPARRRHRPHP